MFCLSSCSYCFIVDILAFAYSSFQLFKGICDIAHRGILIPDKISDYSSFILDQVGVAHLHCLILLLCSFYFSLISERLICCYNVTVDGLPSRFIFFSGNTCHSRYSTNAIALEGSYRLYLHVLCNICHHRNLYSSIRLQALQENHLVMHHVACVWIDVWHTF